MSYTNLEQRMVQGYLDLFPPFVPLPSGPVTIESQEQFYGFMKNVYQTLYNEPECFFQAINEDDAFPNRFNRAAYGKPKLHNQMKKDEKQIEAFFDLLFAFGQNGTVAGSRMVLDPGLKIQKRMLSLLPLFGLRLESGVLFCERFDQLFPAWQWMATRENANQVTFSRCMFDPDYPYMEDAYAALFGSRQAYNTLIAYLHARGYRRVDLRRGPDSVDFVKQIVVKPSVLAKAGGELPVGFPQHGDHYHYGLSMEYRSYASTPQFMTLRILDMKNLLLKFDQMPASLQKFTVQKVQKCNQCGYCTQTDKTGTRKSLEVDLVYEGTQYSVCPLYPGFSFCFSDLDDALVSDLTGFLGFMETHLTESP